MNIPGIPPRLLSILKALVPLLLLAAAGFSLQHEFHGVRWRTLLAELHRWPTYSIQAALGLLALNTVLFAVYDPLAFWALRFKPTPRRAGLVSFLAFAFGNAAGNALVAGGSVRLRFYTAEGVAPARIGAVALFTSVTLWLGFLTLGGLSLLLAPELAHALGLPPLALRAIGALFLSLTIIYLICSARRREFRLFKQTWRLPPFGASLLQITLAGADLTLCALVLYVLLPDGLAISFLPFLGIFMAAQVVALLSQVPGGVGIFESVLLAGLPDPTAGHELLTSLILFRTIYYVLPLAGASLTLLAWEGFVQRERWRRLRAGVALALPSFVPQVLAGLGFLSGSVLLFSTATPELAERMHSLARFVPLFLIEASNLLAAAAGIVLIVAARGLQRRLDAAYFLSLGLLVAGVVLCLLKGVDYEEALVLGFAALLILPCRRYFYRHSSLLAEPWSVRWSVGVGATLLAAAALGFFAHKRVAYSNDLWLEFSLRGDAPRFLRALAVAGLGLAAFGLSRLLREHARPPAAPSPADIETAAQLAAQATDTSAWLATLGDKLILFNSNRTAFFMYGIVGRSWIAYGDPVGPPEATRELFWEFIERADLAGGQAIFYELSALHLPLVVEVGLSLMKLGEEAVVPLARATIEGSAGKDFRQIIARAEREGLRFELAPRERVPELLPALKMISDEWLELKKTREKGFSLGRFQEDYLRRFPMALVYKGETLVAFANVWVSGEELSIDLMRHTHEAPRVTMDYLFVQLMLWGRAQGHARFNLGMAPLSGIEDRRLAPFRAKVAAALYKHAENFYNFQGLRKYKEKFHPDWRPRYLASAEGLQRAKALADAARLISGGWKGLFSK